MNTHTKSFNATLATLDPTMQKQCHAYLDAKARLHALRAEARDVQQRKRQAVNAVNMCSREILERSEVYYPTGTVVWNVRTGRFYEAQACPSNQGWGRKFRHLSAKDARAKPYDTYTYGPFITLPLTHPFVQKRIKARLAETLEGKERG